MTMIDVGGLSETLSMRLNKYSDAFKKAESAMKLLLDLCASPSFETREGWKNSYKKNGEKVYSKQFEIGKIFTLKVNYILQASNGTRIDISNNAEISAGRFALHRPDSQKTLIDYAIYVNPKISSPQRLIDTRIAYMLHRDSMFASKNVQKLRGNNGSREVIKTWNVRGAWRLIDTRIAYMLHRDSMFASKNVQKLRGNNGSREVIKTWNVRGAWVREKRRDSFESELVKMAHLLKA
ncbi:unnamed protein product [Wuchereria bancrofti]|uniref:START domain-containing protein n=1 Tax=Wuchereria bancrofti TaxID=6293 RepID=A0A3P7GCP8_WUCBA|nr:unnamed protein product [Wuchereria bancrofti]